MSPQLPLQLTHCTFFRLIRIGFWHPLHRGRQRLSHSRVTCARSPSVVKSVIR